MLGAGLRLARAQALGVGTDRINTTMSNSILLTVNTKHDFGAEGLLLTLGDFPILSSRPEQAAEVLPAGRRRLLPFPGTGSDGQG
jgi:hypothetical protein